VATLLDPGATAQDKFVSPRPSPAAPAAAPAQVTEADVFEMKALFHHFELADQNSRDWTPR
jgi:hypothetical protein